MPPTGPALRRERTWQSLQRREEIREKQNSGIERVEVQALAAGVHSVADRAEAVDDGSFRGIGEEVRERDAAAVFFDLQMEAAFRRKLDGAAREGRRDRAGRRGRRAAGREGRGDFMPGSDSWSAS